ncbi:MAG TPA: CpaF family protein [Candidatus Scatomonas merdavium]|nr:CpaF family protein [Candidatus Scatomonas merdavium]
MQFEEIRRRLLSLLENRDELSDQDILDAIDELVLAEGRELRLSLRAKEEFRRELFCSVRKLDVIQELVDDPSVTEIMVNGYRNIFVEKSGKIRKWEKAFSSEERLWDVIQQIAGRCNRVVNEETPILDARLANGARVNAVLPPVSLDGPVLTIRRFPDEPITMVKLVAWGSITQEAADFLKKLVSSGYTILVGGGTSTGKTTFLNVLSACIPREERIVTIEDNAELQLLGLDNVVRLEARAANLEGGREITIRDLLRTALRMRPSRIIIGEVRSGEAGDFLSCLNTGHSGSLGSAHANSVRDMIGRLENMVLMGMNIPIPVIRRQIVSGIEILVHLGRDGNGKRRVEEIAEITGLKGDEVQIRTLFRLDGENHLEPVNPLLHGEKLEKKYEKEEKEKTGL